MSSVADRIYRASPWWAQNALLTLYGYRIKQHRYGRLYEEEARAARERERWSAERMREFQNDRLRIVVRQAYESSPYYRELFDARGLVPTDIKTVDDLPRLPLLTKEGLRANAERLLAQRPPKRDSLNGHTSGTTGSPLSIWYDRRTCAVNNAIDRRHKDWAGMKEGDWLGILLGRVVVPPSQRTLPLWRVNHALRQVWFSSFHLTEENLERYAREIRRRNLRFLEGYPSTLYVLAQHLARAGVRLPLQAVISSSETLHPVQRDAIEKAFACRLYDFYAAAERVIFAGECDAHHGKHLAEDYGITEVVDEDGRVLREGEAGYLVGTSLHNIAMPMLRYRMSDVSWIERRRCPCGRTLALLADITTKAEDIVVTPDGRAVSPSTLTHPFKPLDQILKSQIVQERPDRVVVRVVASSELTPAHLQALQDGLRERLGAAMEVDIVKVPDIPREPSGKYRWVISKVPSPYKVVWDRSPPDAVSDQRGQT